jgi:hypothetical protein
MLRGTTPQLTFNMPIDITNAAEVWLTFSQNKREIFTLTKKDMEITSKSGVCRLTQKQTLALDANKRLEMQFRVGFGGTTRRDAVASNIITTTVEEILKDGEI